MAGLSRPRSGFQRIWRGGRVLWQIEHIIPIMESRLGGPVSSFHVSGYMIMVKVVDIGGIFQGWVGPQRAYDFPAFAQIHFAIAVG